VVERPVVVLEDRHADLRAVAGTDRRLVGFLGKPAGRVEAVDTRAPALVCVDVSFPAVDDPDAVDRLEVADRVLRRGDDVLRPVAFADIGLDGEPVVGHLDPRDRPRDA
jgi:hypothetical protein